MVLARTQSHRDAVVLGSGPNGLAAAITLARAGLSVRVLEARETWGGGARSAALMQPGCLHDVCSAVHPLAAASPFFRSEALADQGLKWIHSPAPLAHPLDDGTAVMLERSLAGTARDLGSDGHSYYLLMEPLVREWSELLEDLLAPPRFPKHPLRLAGFGWHGIRSAFGLARSRFQGSRARALFAGLATHAILPLEQAGTAAFGLILALLGHAVGWPIAAGGSQKLSDALVARLRSLGGEIAVDSPVTSLDELGPRRLTLLDVSPRQFLAMTRGQSANPYRRQLERFRPGPGAFKVDWILDAPIPWTASGCARAATVHLGGTLEEIAGAEAAVAGGGVPPRPFVLLAQPSLFDPERAPPGRHTAWAYCHVPNRCAVDMTIAIENQIERFAPGFRSRILDRRSVSPLELERYNPNYIGGDIVGGANDLRQLLGRPVLRAHPYATDLKSVYLCSASTPPGGGVHGMCGYHAACAAMKGSGFV